MKVSDKVYYAADRDYVGEILEVKETLCKVIWFKNRIIEWVPLYSLIALGE